MKTWLYVWINEVEEVYSFTLANSTVSKFIKFVLGSDACVDRTKEILWSFKDK